jgi:hypothetical protein
LTIAQISNLLRQALHTVPRHFLNLRDRQLTVELFRQGAIEGHHGIHSLLSALATGEMRIV